MNAELMLEEMERKDVRIEKVNGEGIDDVMKMKGFEINDRNCGILIGTVKLHDQNKTQQCCQHQIKRSCSKCSCNIFF